MTRRTHEALTGAVGVSRSRGGKRREEASGPGRQRVFLPGVISLGMLSLGALPVGAPSLGALSMRMAHAEGVAPPAPVQTVPAPPAPVPTRAEAAPMPGLLSHKVTYRLDLTRLKAGVLTATGGRATYRIRDLCRSWSVSQKLDLDVTGSDGAPRHVVFQSATLEDKAGRFFRFRTLQTENDETISETGGEARRGRDGRIAVHLTLPDTRVLALPAQVLFPVQFTGLLLSAARKGKLHVQAEIFDGASIDGATISYATLGRLQPAKPDFDSPLFRGARAVPVSVASFSGAGDSLLPDSTYGDRLWTNGVEDRLTIDFGDYVLSGQIESLTSLRTIPCPDGR